MFKPTLLVVALLTTPMTFSALAQAEAAHISISAASGPPSMVEDAIAKPAQEKNATSWKITSMHIDSSTHTTTILHK